DGMYRSAAGCLFDPSGDYSCYKIPSTANTACPEGPAPAAGTPCAVDQCVLCNSLAGLPGGNFFARGGAAKLGWCVCEPPNPAGLRIWSCASDTSWPC